VTFNIINLCANSEWDKTRWKAIPSTITSKDSDIIILYELSKESLENFQYFI